jgi:predicted nucleic acid-binding Zn ribbon protein
MKLYSKESSKKGSKMVYAAYRPCAYCGDSFKGIAGAKYCSDRCVNDVYIARRRERAQLRRANAKNCVVCDTPVEQAQGSVKIKLYCSNACKQKAYRQRKN